MMTRDQFIAALDRYGGDLTRWPPALRQNADVLIAADSNAAADLETARRLNALLAEAVVPSQVDAALIGRILSHGRARRDETILRPTRRLAGLASAAMLATVMIGFVAGVVAPVDQDIDTIATLLFSGADEDIGWGVL